MAGRLLRTLDAAAPALPVGRTPPPREGERRAKLRLAGVCKRWRGHAVPVLSGIDLELPGGSMVLLSGRNGVGKTTLLRMVAGAITPDAGEILACGLSPERDRRAYRGHVGYLPAEDSGLYARLTARQHLHYQSRLTLLPRAIREKTASREASRLRLADLDRRADRLSTGERKRLRVAMVMLRDPAVLLLDEPEGSLDEAGLAMLLDVTGEVLRRGGVVVWCRPAHSGPELAFDRRYMLDRGRLWPI